MVPNREFSMPTITKKINGAIIVFTLASLFANIVFDFFAVKKILSETYDTFLTQIAYTGASYFKGDKLERFAREGLKSEEYKDTLIKLANLTENTDISFLYVIIPEMPDCKYKTYVFNVVNTKLRNKFNPYHAGYKEDTSASSAARFKNLMEKGGMELDSTMFSQTGARTRVSLALRDSTGKKVGIICVEKQMDTVTSVLKNYIRIDLLYAPIVSLLFFICFGTFISKKFVRPIVSITREANGFASHDAHFSDKLKEIHSNDEIETLARSIEKMGIDIQIYIKDLMRVTSEKERISAELSVASGIQAGMLPKNFSPYPDHPGIQLYASMIPAKEVGGDFYDFFWTGKDKLWLVMGDVSGKGVPAAMFMVIAKALIRNAATQDYEPSEICERVNNQLCKENEQGLFVTCWLGCVNLSTGLMKYANAAHNPPVLYDGKEYKFLREKSGIMLAAMEDTKYVEYEIQLNKGNRLFIYTDGVTEEQNKNGQLFGEDLLLGALAKNAALTAKEKIEAVNAELDRFAGGESQADDITALAFYLDELSGAEGAKAKERILDLPAADEKLADVLDFIKSNLPDGVSNDLKNKIDLAAEEIFVNISHYAYEEATGKAQIVCENPTPNSIKVSFVDWGKEFNPLEQPDPDFTQSAEERRLGGFGIYLTKQFMDKVSYCRQDGKNILTIEKSF
ncbi:MAG: SpoIIE family protein phosphatase [Treponema sp.]|nr:SpoIIE family protein phosphatase [Treponema sp.]